MVRPSKSLSFLLLIAVSIHAPLAGATLFFDMRILVFCVFNPRTPGGATTPIVVTFLFPKFQSTHPCGCDPLSIRQAPQPGKFQSTHPCGCDRSCGTILCPSRSFNPRTLRGATGSQIGLLSLHGCFNPRTPAGCDYWSWSSQTTSGVSIHAPLRGATDARVILNGDLLQF